MHDAIKLIEGTSFRGRLRHILLAIFFAICMIPINVGGDGAAAVSVNYSFLLYPILMLFLGKLRKPPEAFLMAMTFFCLIFGISTIYQTDMLSEFVRRMASFIVFMSIFSFMFVEIDDKMVAAFKAAIVLAACYFALKSIIIFFVLGGSSLGDNAKNAVGGQRYGFIYLMAFWVTYLSSPKPLLARIVKPGLVFIMLIGLALTFSRASIVALMSSFGLFTILSLRDVSFDKLLKGALLTAIGGVLGYFILNTYFSFVLTFFGDRLFDFFSNTSLVQRHLATASSSEGARIQEWTAILNFVSNNPFTGSGYLGAWTLIKTGGLGSAHNQYFDVLLRTDIFGFLIYLAFLFQIGKLLRTRDRGLFWGLCGTIVYGMFHETFKESQGAFLLTFLLGMIAQGQLAVPNLPGLRAFVSRKPPAFTPS